MTVNEHTDFREFLFLKRKHTHGALGSEIISGFREGLTEERTLNELGDPSGKRQLW